MITSFLGWLGSWGNSWGAVTASGRLKYWDGAAWQVKTLKYWTGSTWQIKTLKYWDGSTWI